MVDWRGLDTVLDQLEALLKVVHFTSGVYIWEFFSALSFEWSFLRGRRKWSWTVALYIACRVTTLAAAVSQMTGFNFTSEISCKTWLIFVRIFANTSTTLAMALYALRSVAVWKRNDWLILFVVGCLITNVVLWMRLTVRPASHWNEETRTCIVTNSYRGLPNNASMLATDVVFFIVILSGVYQRNSGRHIMITMYHEGLFWLAIATLIQLLPVIFISLDLNDVMNLMFQTPAIICAGIGATRMYRKIFDRHAGDMLEYLESSRNEETGEIRFRRASLLVARLGHDGDRNAPRCAPRAVPPGRELNELYVERFGECEIRLEGAETEARMIKIDPDLVL
ncbi:hypothetical protein EDB92DRAFT_2105033 [Lactarius akahatsu]|uniref:Uncharacterized protein n=1 Tax=Lactarius akahatsu TaxID=416441 RepID=A0AAD4QBG1_9AGAM|nr:hypothetical protein EDB92DRAFT_2105033 [Lactarius akahatsu]